MRAAPADVVRAHLGRARRRARDAVLGTDPAVRTVREDLALRYLRGDGLEIGALDFPLGLPRGARVRYVDRMDVAGLRADFPNLADHDFVPVHVVDDGETLSTVGDASVDFVVANHFIEHTQDPAGALASHARVLRPGGVLYLAVPDKRHTFDRERPITPLAHLVADHEQGPERSRREHYEEWARLVERVAPEDVGDLATTLERRGASIHFHVWDLAAFVAFAVHLTREMHVALDLEHVEANGHEFVVVMRKSDSVRRR